GAEAIDFSLVVQHGVVCIGVLISRLLQLCEGDPCAQQFGGTSGGVTQRAFGVIEFPLGLLQACKDKEHVPARRDFGDEIREDHDGFVWVSASFEQGRVEEHAISSLGAAGAGVRKLLKPLKGLGFVALLEGDLCVSKELPL